VLTGYTGGDDVYAGNGADTIRSNAGNDYINSDDSTLVFAGSVDRVYCGAGTDTVDADFEDVISASCETVNLP
jgi:Ca2+-binding RTX toxin-like protein